MPNAVHTQGVCYREVSLTVNDPKEAKVEDSPDDEEFVANTFNTRLRQLNHGVIPNPACEQCVSSKDAMKGCRFTYLTPQ